MRGLRIAITASAFDMANLPSAFASCEVIANMTGRRLDSEGLVAMLSEGVHGTIAGLEPYDERALSAAKGLRAISRIGTGTDSIDLGAARQHGVVVLRTPDAPCAAVAELTVGMVLAGLRHLVYHHQQVTDGIWAARRGGLLEGRIVGLIGAGRIARAVAARLVGFGASVQATDPYVEQRSSALSLVGLEKLLRTSDIVSLHVPSDANTSNMLDRARIGMMKHSAMLVNTARGGLIDEDALIDALRTGRLAFAAVDAFAQEPYAGGLSGLDNVLLTPHIGSNTVETRRAMEREAAKNLGEALGLVGRCQRK